MLWSPNLQLLYPFQNQANDYSGNARHGTVNGSGVYATRPNGSRCLYFDGTGDYVATPSFGLSGTVVVFACDIRSKTFAVDQALVGDAAQSSTVGFLRCYREGGSPFLYWMYADGASHRYGSGGPIFADPFNDVWLFLLIVCDYGGKQIYFYRNGLPFGSPVAMTGTPVFPSTTRVKYIGSYNATPVNPLTDGYLQNVQLWTLPTMPPIAQVTANANRLMLGMNPIW